MRPRIGERELSRGFCILDDMCFVYAYGEGEVKEGHPRGGSGVASDSFSGILRDDIQERESDDDEETLGLVAFFFLGAPNCIINGLTTTFTFSWMKREGPGMKRRDMFACFVCASYIYLFCLPAKPFYQHP